MMIKKMVITLSLASLLMLCGCTAGDPYPDDAYFGDIYSHGVLLGAGGGDMFKATYDPANIGQQLVGLSAAQNLTNKQLMMNNADPIKWKTAGGVPQDTINLLGSNILQITNPIGSVQILGGSINLNYNVDEDIYLWGGTKGTGRELVVYSGYATALDTLRDSPTLDMAATYWDGGAAVGWSGTILHDMITAGVTPKSQLKFSINSASILRLENDNGVVKTFSDGNLSMVNSTIDMSQIGAEPASTANRAGIYAIDLAADNCTIGFNTETVVLNAVAIVSTNKIPIRWNGVTYYLLVTTVP